MPACTCCRKAVLSLEDVYWITIQKLKTWGFLNRGKRNGILTLYRNGKKSGWLNISVNINSFKTSFIEFKYSVNEKPVKYSHKIDLLPCYFGNYRFYFICRDTNKRVTALYLVGGYFSSRHFHKLVYQCSREHRSFFYALFREEIAWKL